VGLFVIVWGLFGFVIVWGLCLLLWGGCACFCVVVFFIVGVVFVIV